MKTDHAAACNGALDGAPGGEAAGLLTKFDALREENDALGRDLLRCYEQLSLVFEISEHIANLQDPQVILRVLLRRYGAMLGAGALLLDRDTGCTQFVDFEPAGARVNVDPQLIHELLSADLEIVRQSHRSRVCTLAPAAQRALNGAHVLLSGLHQYDEETVIVVVLRDAREPCFDSGDMQASEAVLGYGGQLLSNVLMLRRLQQTVVETVGALANAIDAKDNYTSGHSERVGWLARFTGEAMGLSKARLEVLEWSGLLHDVGKIGIPERILNKPGKLTDEEFAEMKRHPRMSYEVLKPISRFEPVLDGVLYHHENHDGSGYPTGLKGDSIPLAARIIHVVDIFDALTSTRSYRHGFSIEQAYDILRKDAGRVTDPLITSVFIDAFDQYRRQQPENFQRRFGHVVVENAGQTKELPE